MTRNILILGRMESIVEDARRQLQLPDVQVFGGTSMDDVRSVFAGASIDHVIVGAGIDLETRLEIVREVFRLSGATSVHLKDAASGPEGFLPFVQSVVRGLQG